jgi:Arc/MetJ-type ribon-helix-helix transcriptional regulator
MDRAVFDNVEREIDDEVRARFPGDVIKQAVLLHYGDEPEIEPGELWVRVLLRAERPEEYEQTVSAFARDHLAAMEEFPRYLAETLREIRLVEFTFPDNPVTSVGHGPRRHLIVSDRVTDVRERELGEATRVDVRLGPANVEALDTLIMAGIADNRAAAVRWVLARFRQQPEYEQLRERVLETGRLRAVHRPLPEADTDRAVFDSFEREVEHEVHKRFPGDSVQRVVLLHYGDDPEIEPGELWVRVFLRADRPEEYDQIIRAFERDHQAAIEGFLLELIGRLREIRMVEFTFSKNPATSEKDDGPCNRMEFGQRLVDLQAWERGEATHVPARLGPAGLETVDTLIMAGIADDRSDAIRVVLPNFREQPEYEQLRERVREIDRLRAEG